MYPYGDQFEILKYTTHGSVIQWGEGKLLSSPTGDIVLLRKACTLSLIGDPIRAEWYTWVDRDSPHARLVWRSQIPGLLQKSVWYSLQPDSLCANVRSVMWGVGCKRYPSQWRIGNLRRFWGMYPLGDLISWRQQQLRDTGPTCLCNFLR